MKLKNLRIQMKQKEIEALLITNTFNLRYMTQFTGTSGVALVSKDDAVFITDFRYTEQAAKEIEGYRIVKHEKTMIEEVAEQVKKMSVKTVGFEKR